MALFICLFPLNFSARLSITGFPASRAYTCMTAGHTSDDRSIPIDPAKDTQGTNLVNAEVSA